MTLNSSSSLPVGIDDMAVYVPQLYLPISDLADARNIEYAKLSKGLGLTAMAINDIDEDAATMAANAVRELIDKNKLDPRQIGRIYMGTESALDGAKPMASYVVSMLEEFYQDQFGADCLLNCDVVDLTFACIGAVDAMQNTLDWVRADHQRIGIIVASDVAKYELASTGEYTQGAGAVAVLVKQSPRLLTLSTNWGVATRGVHDFFKPTPRISKQRLIEEVLALTGNTDLDAASLLQQMDSTLEVNGILDSNDSYLTLHRETPVFDGPYSNNCYQQRIGEALSNFFAKNGLDEQEENIIDRWERLLFHLPYAFQARRMFAEIYMEEQQKRGAWEAIAATLGQDMPAPDQFDTTKDYEKAYGKYLRAITKTEGYRKYVGRVIEPSERASSLVGNIYTGSIFLALMSSLETDLNAETDLAGTTLGFFAYGSGSKSKVFEGKVQAGWKEITARFELFTRLRDRKVIDYTTYENMHRSKQTQPVLAQKAGFTLSEVNTESGVREGARTYALPSKKLANVEA
ncbi:MAG: hydroxymethylglutaryl-CoA synthase [Bacteroidota bacterium]